MPPKPLSDERVADSSEEESETEQQQNREPLEISQNAQLEAAIDSDNESDGSSDDGDSGSTSSDSSSTSTTTSKRKSQSNVTPNTEHGSKRQKTRSVTVSNADRPADFNSGTTVKRIEAPIHVPPRGFSKLESVNGNDTNDLFTDLDGKQIWHITAPASMPMSELTTLDLSTSLQGAPILQTNATTYVVSRLPAAQVSVLSARGKDATFVPVSQSISRSLRIQEFTKKVIEKADAGETPDNAQPAVTFFATSPGTKRVPRKQPSGLKGRYLPFGVYNDQTNAEPSKPADVMDIDDIVTPKKGSQSSSKTSSTPKSKKKSKQKA